MSGEINGRVRSRIRDVITEVKFDFVRGDGETMLSVS